MQRIALVEMRVGTRSDLDPSELILNVQSLDQEESPTWTHRSRRIDDIVRRIAIGEGWGMQAHDRKRQGRLEQATIISFVLIGNPNSPTTIGNPVQILYQK